MPVDVRMVDVNYTGLNLVANQPSNLQSVMLVSFVLASLPFALASHSPWLETVVNRGSK